VASTLTLPLAFAVESFVDTNHLNPQLVAPAKIVATRCARPGVNCCGDTEARGVFQHPF
jgi:hypothetical protein